MKKLGMMCILMWTIIFPNYGVSGNVTDHLIMQDIGQYKFMGKGGGLGSGIISATGHFSTDHTDESYGCMYFNEVSEIGVNVEVTKHAGSDSDKWLLHEVERGFRDTDNMESGPDEDSMIREVDGNRIYFYGGGVVGYRWISNKVAINIQYTNPSEHKPEPLEVVKAYLAKFPSSIVLNDTAFKARTHNEKWIKDEMDRRLWLCDKWFMQLQLKKAEEKQVYQESVKSMNVFLDYREKYYGPKAADEKNLLAGYLSTNNGSGIKIKLKEYKDWWVVNKDKAINL